MLGQCKASIKLARPPECLLDFARLRLLGTLDLTEALSASSAFESEADAARVVRMLAHDTVRIMYKASPPPGEERTRVDKKCFHQHRKDSRMQNGPTAWWYRLRSTCAKQRLGRLKTDPAIAADLPPKVEQTHDLLFD